MLRPDIKHYIKHPIEYIRYRKSQKEFAKLFSEYEPEIIKVDMSDLCRGGKNYVVMSQKYSRGFLSKAEWQRWCNTHCNQCTFYKTYCRYCAAKTYEEENML